MAAERVDYPSLYEGLFLKGLADKLTLKLKDRLRAEGLDLDRSLRATYPAEKFRVCVGIALEEAFPGVPREEALRELGRRFLQGYVGTRLGKGLVFVMKAMGPMRTLSQMDRAFRTGSSYLSSRFQELGKKDAELWLNETHGMPEFFEGLLAAGAEVVGAKAPEVKVSDTDGHGATFRIRWS